MDVADGPSSGGGGEEDGGVDMMMDRVAAGAVHPQHGLSSKKMGLITSDCGTTRCLGTKWP